MLSNATPSDAEFNGYYNVPGENEADDRRHLDTFPGPHALTLSEVKRVSNDAYELIYLSANQKGFTPDEVRNYYNLCISEGLVDRTLNISFIDVDDCTHELVERLRRLLASDYPLWRIRIAGSTTETTVVIYPNLVRYGTFPTNVDGGKALAALQVREAELRDHPVDTQEHRAFLKRTMARLIAAGVVNSPVLVASFDNYVGDESKATIWTLCGADIADLEFIFPEDAMSGDLYRVKNDGEYGYHIGNESPYWVREWIFSKKNPLTHLQFKAYDSSYCERMIELEVDLKQFAFRSPT